VTTTRNVPPECIVLRGEALHQVEEAIRSSVGPDEIVIHFDLIVETRYGENARKIRFRRFTMPGSDPLLSLGLLDAAIGRLRRRLGVGGD
jgi:hypothetical protein